MRVNGEDRRVMDCRCGEIRRLSGAEAADYSRSHLRELVIDPTNWQTLYDCPATGTLWKEYHPRSEQHGGGPPKLVVISPQEAKAAFNYPDTA
jgi:Immunity protein 27